MIHFLFGGNLDLFFKGFLLLVSRSVTFQVSFVSDFGFWFRLSYIRTLQKKRNRWNRNMWNSGVFNDFRDLRFVSIFQVVFCLNNTNTSNGGLFGDILGAAGQSMLKRGPVYHLMVNWLVGSGCWFNVDQHVSIGLVENHHHKICWIKFLPKWVLKGGDEECSFMDLEIWTSQRSWCRQITLMNSMTKVSWNGYFIWIYHDLCQAYPCWASIS